MAIQGIGVTYRTMVTNAKNARTKADIVGYKTYGELSKSYGYNVVALASRFANGWTIEEIRNFRHDGIEISPLVVLDQSGTPFTNAGSFCSKFGINLKKLLNRVQDIKTTEEYLCVIFELKHGDKLNAENTYDMGSIDDVVSELEDNERGNSVNAKTEVVKSVYESHKESTFSADMLDLAERLRADLISNHSNIGVIYEDEDGEVEVLPVSEVARRHGVTIGDLVVRVTQGFMPEDIIDGAYYASDDDKGEYDFPRGIDGLSVDDFCKKYGFSTVYLLTKYRRNDCKSSNSNPVTIAEEYSKRGTAELSLLWACSKHRIFV